jgi:hypothetical protein
MKTVKILLLAFMLLPIGAKVEMQWQKNRAISLLCGCKNEPPVRGVSFEDFRASVKEFWRCDKSALLDTAWQLWKAERWMALEDFFGVHHLNGGWPPNYGAMYSDTTTLDSGVLIDRYGGYYLADRLFRDTGKFVCDGGIPLADRAMRPDTARKPYRLYRVIKAIGNIKKGGIIPWFHQRGLGAQFLLPANIECLKQCGYIVEVSSKQPN